MKNIIFTALTFTVILAASSCSRPKPEIMFTPFEVYPENDWTIMGFAFGDIDGDGFADLVTHEGAGGGSIQWFRSPGEGAGWQSTEVASIGPNGTHFSTGDLEIGDIDSDGDIDILAFEHPGEWSFNYTGKKLPTRIFWYENREGGSQWSPHYIGEAPDFVKDVELLHLDSNNLLDIVTVTYIDDHNFSVFRHDSIDLWTRVQSFSITNLHEGMDSGDIDGDGDPDIATNGYWIENPGGNLEEVWKIHVIDEKWHNQTGDWRNNATKTVCYDLNGDHRMEVFISHSEETGYSISLYESMLEGNERIWKEQILAKGYTAVHTLQVGDLDNDGDQDVLFGENADHTVKGDDSRKQVRILLNEGNNASWKKVFFSDQGLYNGLVVDLNGDSLLDIAGSAGHEKDAYTVWMNRGPIKE